MQRFTLAAAALVAAVSASEFNWNSTCDDNQPKVRIINKCPYDVNLWSVMKGTGCPNGEGAILQAGSGIYQENFRNDTTVGVSIKMSKTTDCKGPGDNNGLQLEYFINGAGKWASNYLDVSYVDCHGYDCPTIQEGFHLKAGNQDGVYMASPDNTVNPVLKCWDPESCKKVAYWEPNDVQTKSCNLAADLVFTMCSSDGESSSGGNGGSHQQSSAAPLAPSAPSKSSAPKSSAAYTPAPAPSSSAAESPAYTPSPKHEVAGAAADAAVTSAPAVAPAQPNIKTEVVYVTEYTYGKRHAHGHRHQHFRA